MNIRIRHLAFAFLAACSLAAQAEPLRLSITGNFEAPPLTSGPNTLSLSFDLSDPLVGVVAESAEAFVISNLRIEGLFNGTPNISTDNLVGWFSYVDSSYHGIDLRLRNLLVPGDLMQFIINTPMSLYTGPSTEPTLERLDLSSLGGAVCYYGTGSGACTADGPMWDVSYVLSPVPEPAAAWMLALGLAAVALRRQHQRRAT